MINKEKLEQLKFKARENYVPILQDDSMQVIKTLKVLLEDNY